MTESGLCQVALLEIVDAIMCFLGFLASVPNGDAFISHQHHFHREGLLSLCSVLERLRSLLEGLYAVIDGL